MWASLLEMTQYGFFQRALLAILLIAPLLGALGCLVIETRMTFFSDAVGHAGLAGIALGTLLGMQDPLLALVGFSVLLAFAVTGSRRQAGLSSDAAIGIFQSTAVALGVVLLSRNGGFARYSRYLIGDLLSITSAELVRLGILVLVFLPVWAFFFNRMLLSSLGEALSRSRGHSPWRIQLGLAALIAVVVAVSLQWVGVLVIQALIVLPAVAARNLGRSTAGWFWLSIGIAVLSGILGLVASSLFSTATGATVVLFAFGFFLASLGWKRLRRGAA